FLKGEKCLTKCTLEKRNSPPGMHQQRRRKVSDFALQLREKQKARRMYGVLERQMNNTFDRASEVTGATGETLLINLECRLDNAVYRAGFAKSRPQARQLVAHGHITVNGRVAKAPSHEVQQGDQVAVKESSRALTYFKEVAGWAKTQTRPGWLEPLPPGYGTTLGNSLRRVLLSSLEGAAITSARVRGVAHEFSTIPGVKEDVVQMVLNLKQIRLRSFATEPVTLTLEKTGPGE